MKKLFLFLFASLLSISMFADNDGSTKAKAIPYLWGEGIQATSEAGVGKWYVVDLSERFNPQTGKSTQGNADANIVVSNPLNEKANVDVTAYVGDNEMSRHFTLAPGEFKTMNIGAGFLVRSGIRYVYMFIVMDVTVTQQEAEKIHVVVEDAPANSTPFVPVDFIWTNFPAKTVANVIPANKETWVKIEFPGVANGSTYKFYVEKDDATPITINAGISYDCPASSIQEQSQELKSASTAKILDEAKLSMIPGTIYIRIKAAQELRIYAEQVAIPAPEPGAQPIFNILTGNENDSPAIEVQLYNELDPNTVYTLNAGHLVYSVDYATLQAEPNCYRQIEVTNNGPQEVTIVGKASKTPDTNGNVYSVATKTVTIPAGQTYTKKIDKTMQNVVGSAAGDKIYALGPEFPNVTFKLTQQPEDPEFCQNAQQFEWGVWNNQAGNSYKWYEIDITAAKNAKADIVLTMETADGSEANITVDMAAACQAGEPLQNYNGKSKSTTKTLTYSLYKDKQSDYMYARVRTDKNIKVKAELLTTKTWNGSAWSGDGQAPTLAEAARIEGNLTIGNGEVINALGLTLTSIPASDPVQYYTITIENGGKLIIGDEGVKGSNVVEQIVVEEGGMLLISPKATTNNKPFVTVKKGLFLGKQENDGAELQEYHEYIALPIENRQAGVGQVLRYVNWGLYEGWGKEYNGFRNTFEGYNVFTKAGDASYTNPAATLEVSFKGQLVANKNVRLDATQWGWFSFGNSWTAPIALEDIYDQFPTATDKEQAVHFYVAKPTEYNMYGIGTLPDNTYLPATKDIAEALNITQIKPMQGFFLYTEGAYTITLDYSKVYNANKGATSPAPKRKAKVADNRNKVAAVLSDSRICDFVYMIEGEATSAHKMIGNGLAIYAEDGLAQVANNNLIGTTLTIQTNNNTEYTLSFTWLNGETLYLLDLVNNEVIEMTADKKYTFTAEPNTTTERFQVIGRRIPTAIENTNAINGVNKVLENGKIVIFKNGVKYNVLGAQL